MVEEIAGQTGALAKLMFSKQLLGTGAGGQIERLLITHLAGNAELKHQRLQAGDCVQTCKVGSRRPFEAVSLRQLGEGAVDFPQQHRRRGGGAAATGKFAIDDDDIKSLARETLGDERPGDAAADDQRVAFDVLADFKPPWLSRRGKPGRMAAPKVGLFSIICIEKADDILLIPFNRGVDPKTF